MPGHVSDPPKPFRSSARTRAERTGAHAARRRSANVSIDADVLREAKAMKINLSRTLEDALRGLLREEQLRRFDEDHREAFQSYNEFIAENGLWGEEYRKW
ncbi:MAG TPA: type II toxin-antitoxin system CcdA family antitoxin [Rhizomicrobium sp.]|jgi:antitoxin CcdA|nr:type II toxin-antitoxin system CcdA family antitoxin [Rhizomicrobium sp.]